MQKIWTMDDERKSSINREFKSLQTIIDLR